MALTALTGDQLSVLHSRLEAALRSVAPAQTAAGHLLFAAESGHRDLSATSGDIDTDFCKLWAGRRACSR